MEFRILGPLEVHGESGAVALGAVKPRAVLAVLLLHANEPVSAERLALALWGETAHPDATRTVQVYVSRLRKALGDGELVATTPAGYRLRVGPDELDAERFVRGVEAGRRALAAGAPEQAAQLLREALALWRGPPLAGLEFEPFAAAEIARLEEQRLAALEARVEADLAAGGHAALVSELRQLLAEHPTRERFAGQLMLALYRSGRQAEALEVYRGTRRVLVEEVGIEPSPELQRLHGAVLGQDVSLELPACGELPGELDADGAPPLVGRDAELGWLRGHWKAARTGHGRLVTVGGADGVGKTRLVAELAGEVHRAGGAVVYLAGRGPPARLVAALGELRHALRPTLLVLDDAESAAAEVGAALGELVPALGELDVLVLACGRDADALGGVAARDALVLKPLDGEAVRAIAAERGVPADWLLGQSDGVPRRVHEAAGRWARCEAARRVDDAAGRAAAGRAELRSVEAELTGGVIELQAAGEDAEWAGRHDAPVRCPFRGLASFDVVDAPYFFGRERLVAELVARLVGATLLGIVGPSGSGKSSVVRAGLLPALAGGVLPGSADWERVVMRPGEHPLRELANATARIDRDRRVLLAVDQFEETFTLCRDEAERGAFVADLVADRDGRIVVLAIRADHYGRCGAYSELARLLAAHHVLVSAMRRDELRRAVERPAQRVGLRVEPELSDALVGDVEHEPGALPMLSTALLELWQRRDGRRLRLATYEATGGVRGAVARHAEDAFARLDRDQQALARRVLLRLAAEDAAGTVERRRIALAELDDDAAAEVVGVLTDQRLLTVSAGAVELAHEALLREWPRLRGWLEEDAEGRRLHRRLAAAAREWDDAGRDAGDLYRGARLASALEWRARHEPDLNRTERDFLDAGRTAEQREYDAAHVRRRRAITLGVAVLAVITGISTMLAVRGIQRARYEQRAAASRALATRALARLPDDVAQAGLLALEAYRREPTVEARSAVLSVLPSLASYRRIANPLQHPTAVGSVAISPDGRTLAAAADDGTISLWEVARRRRLGRPLLGHDGAVHAVAFSPNGTRLASGGDDGTVRLWDVSTRRAIGRPLRQHDGAAVHGLGFSPDGTTLATAGSGAPPGNGPATLQFWDVAAGRALGAALETGTSVVGAVEFSPDGKLLAAAVSDNTVQLWDPTTRRRLGPPLAGHTDQVVAVAFSPDARTLASGGADGIVQLWDVRARRALGAPLEGDVSNVRSVAFSPDGSTLASGGDDATVRLWSVATHRPRGVLAAETDRPAARPVAGGAAGVTGVAFSPRGGILASADEAGAVQLWDTGARHPLSRPLQGHSGWVRGVAFTSDGTLASAGTDGSVRLWDSRRARALGRPLPSGAPVFGMAASPDGRMLAVGGAKGLLQIWAARARRPLGPPLAGDQGDVKALAFSPDGDTLASGGDDGTVRLWNAEHRQPLGPPLDAHAGAVNGVAFAPDGKILAAAEHDGTVRLWDVGDRRALDPPLRGPAGFVAAVAFSPDGHILASAGADKSVWLWDVDERRPLAPPLTGHTDVLHALAFSPDGRTLASAGADHTVRLWDVHTRRPLGQPLQHTSWVSALAFDPGGGSLASAGDGGTIRLWDPILWSHDRQPLTARLCGAIRRSLTHAEWAQFLPDQPFHQTCLRPA